MVFIHMLFFFVMPVDYILSETGFHETGWSRCVWRSELVTFTPPYVSLSSLPTPLLDTHNLPQPGRSTTDTLPAPCCLSVLQLQLHSSTPPLWPFNYTSGSLDSHVTLPYCPRTSGDQGKGLSLLLSWRIPSKWPGGSPKRIGHLPLCSNPTAQPGWAEVGSPFLTFPAACFVQQSKWPEQFKEPMV